MAAKTASLVRSTLGAHQQLQPPSSASCQTPSPDSWVLLHSTLDAAPPATRRPRKANKFRLREQVIVPTQIRGRALSGTQASRRPRHLVLQVVALSTTTSVNGGPVGRTTQFALFGSVPATSEDDR